MKSYSIENFIEFVVNLVNEDDIFLERQVDARYYFMHGGCYELYKIVKNYFPYVKCMIQNNFEHCVIEYQGKIYDAMGKREDIKNFKAATTEDLEYMDNRFGLNLKNLEAPKIIENIEKCCVKNILY